MPGSRQRLAAIVDWGSTGAATSNRSFACPPGAAPQWGAQRRARELLVESLNDQAAAGRPLARWGATQDPVAALPEPKVPSAHEVEAFVDAVLRDNSASVVACVEALRGRGASIETVYLDLLTPAARRLGEFWVQDLCNFTEVTLGLVRLHQILRELSPAFRQEVAFWDSGRRVLLAPAPGEQHMFGLCMVAEFFRRAGWDVICEPSMSLEDLVGVCRAQWFAVVGLSVSCESSLNAVASVIRSIRRTSQNRAVAVMVGGQTFLERPDLATEIGADRMAVDGNEAITRAQELLVEQAPRC